MALLGPVAEKEGAGKVSGADTTVLSTMSVIYGCAEGPRQEAPGGGTLPGCLHPFLCPPPAPVSPR